MLFNPLYPLSLTLSNYSNRLHLARCDIAADRSRWQEAGEHAAQALTAVETSTNGNGAAARQAGPLAIYCRVSALLALGAPVEAADTRWDGQRAAARAAPPCVVAARLASAEAGSTQWPERASEGERDMDAHQTDFFDEPDLGFALLSRERAAHTLIQVRLEGFIIGERESDEGCLQKGENESVQLWIKSHTLHNIFCSHPHT